MLVCDNSLSSCSHGSTFGRLPYSSCTSPWLPPWGRTISQGRAGIIKKEQTSHSSNTKSLEIVCIREITLYSWFDTGINFKDPKLIYSKSFEDELATNLWGVKFLCWIDGITMLVCDTSLSSCSHDPTFERVPYFFMNLYMISPNLSLSGILLPSLQFSRLKSLMPFKRDLAFQNISLSNQPFQTQPQIENEDVTWSPQYNLPTTRTNKRRALPLQEVELHGWFLIFHIALETCTI